MVIQPTPVANLLIIAGEGAWVFSAGAQLRKLIKTRRTHGLSAPTQTLSIAGNFGWCTYFATNHLWYPFVTNILVILLSLGVLGFTLSNHKQFMGGLLSIAVLGPLTSYLLIRYPASAGWIGVVYNNIAGVPQLRKIVRHKKSGGLSGHGLFFSSSALLLTLTYALLIHSSPLIVGCGLGLLSEFVIWHHFARYRHLT